MCFFEKSFEKDEKLRKFYNKYRKKTAEKFFGFHGSEKLKKHKN